MLAVLLAALDFTVVATALPTIVGELRGFEQLSWVVTAYLVSSTITIPIYGKLSDVYGRRRLLLVSVSIFLVGSTLCGVAGSMPALIAARAIQGLGAGGLIPLAQAAVADLFSPRERGRYSGMLGSMWAAAALAGPLVGGTLTDQVSWRWIFFLNVPLCLVVIAVLLRTMPAKVAPAGPRQIDWGGAAVVSVATTGILLATAWGGTTYPWGSFPVVAAATTGVVLLIAFVVLETRVAVPLIPLRLFGDRMVSALAAASFVLGGLLFGVAIFIPVFVQGVLGSSATGAGAVLVPHLICWVVSGSLTGIVITRTGRYRAFPALGCVAIVAGTIPLLGADPGTPKAAIAAAAGLIGIGAGMAIQTITIAVQNAVPRADVGVATGLIFFSRFMGGSVAVAALGALLTSRFGVHLTEELGAAARLVDRDAVLHGGRGVQQQFEAGTRDALSGSLHAVFVSFVPLALIGLACSVRLPARPLDETMDERPAPAPDARVAA
jgi:EmrB/QacA subfamily drug resistance transporter